MTGTLHIGNALDVLRRLPSESVHCCVTSPPYWGLRDYGAEGQLGLEPTPEEHVTAVVAVFEEVRRVLRSDGTLWMNYGDSYAGAGYSNLHNNTCGGGYPERALAKSKSTPVPPGLKPKDLVGMPWMVAFALRAAGWYLRSDIIWSKPNPMPESVTDRPTSAHEYLFLLAKSPRYFYDADAIREAASESIDRWKGDLSPRSPAHGNSAQSIKGQQSLGTPAAGRNKRSVWTVATQPYSGAHFATFPPKLITPCILAGTSERGCCSSCGAPRVRVTSPATGGTIGTDNAGWNGGKSRDAARKLSEGKTRAGKGQKEWSSYHPRATTGWQPSCKCDAAPEPCTVLDPFGGSGTTAEVAEALGRRWVLIELNPEYEPLIRQRTAQRGLFSR